MNLPSLPSLPAFDFSRSKRQLLAILGVAVLLVAAVNGISFLRNNDVKIRSPWEAASVTVPAVPTVTVAPASPSATPIASPSAKAKKAK